MNNKKRYITELAHNTFTAKNLIKGLTIFIVGFSLRVFIGYAYEINVFLQYKEVISILYYTIMSFLAILVHEIVTYFNIGFNCIKIFSNFNDNKFKLTGLDPNNVKKDDVKSESFINKKGKSNNIEHSKESSKRNRSISTQSDGSEISRHRDRHVNRRPRLSGSHNNNMTAQNNVEPRDRLFSVDTIRERDSTNSIPITTQSSRLNNLYRDNGLSSLSSSSTYYDRLPATTYNPNNSPSNYGQINRYSPVDYSTQYAIPSAPRPSNLSTPSTMSPLFPPESPQNTVYGNSVGNNNLCNSWISRTTPSTTYTTTENIVVDEKVVRSNRTTRSEPIDWSRRRAVVQENFEKEMISRSNSDGGVSSKSNKSNTSSISEKFKSAVKKVSKDLEKTSKTSRELEVNSKKSSARLMNDIRGARQNKACQDLNRFTRAMCDKPNKRNK